MRRWAPPARRRRGLRGPAELRALLRLLRLRQLRTGQGLRSQWWSVTFDGPGQAAKAAQALRIADGKLRCPKEFGHGSTRSDSGALLLFLARSLAPPLGDLDIAHPLGISLSLSLSLSRLVGQLSTRRLRASASLSPLLRKRLRLLRSGQGLRRVPLCTDCTIELCSGEKSPHLPYPSPLLFGVHEAPACDVLPQYGGRNPTSHPSPSHSHPDPLILRVTHRYAYCTHTQTPCRSDSLTLKQAHLEGPSGTMGLPMFCLLDFCGLVVFCCVLCCWAVRLHFLGVEAPSFCFCLVLRLLSLSFALLLLLLVVLLCFCFCFCLVLLLLCFCFCVALLCVVAWFAVAFALVLLLLCFSFCFCLPLLCLASQLLFAFALAFAFAFAVAFALLLFLLLLGFAFA